MYSESTDSFYKGQTQDLELRLNRHNNGYEKSTRKGVPWTLTWKSEMTSRSEAVKLERKLKNIGRKKLLDFIDKYNQEAVAGPEIR